MTVHMHLRAVPEGEVRADATWLETFMRDAWYAHEVESAAGVSTAIEHFGTVSRLHLAASRLDGGPGADAAELPVYGGRVVNAREAHGLPFVLLGAEEVRGAATFLDGADFDALWGVAGAELAASWDGADEAAAERCIRDRHLRLRGFYRRAAAAGHEVVKAFHFF